MIDLRPQRELLLAAPPEPRRPSHISAASALVRSGDSLYVVADDEHHLGVFPCEGDAVGRLITLVDGELPVGRRERKRRKPDFEALTLLPAFNGYAHGAMLALGSGSRRRRRIGALLALDAKGAVLGPPRLIDLTGPYIRLKDRFADLNIEGATVVDDALVLLQRGNKGHRDNACIHFALAPILSALAAGDALYADNPIAVRSYDLGAVHGVPLSFTDAAALPGGEIVFSAIAEDTPNSYDDGPCIGAAAGVIACDGEIRMLETLARPYKVEGIHAWRGADGIHLLAVTDADNVNVPASLLSGCLPDT